MRLRSAHLLTAVCFLLVTAGSAYGADVSVDCSNPKAKLKTITAALATISNQGPNTIHVSGTCNESVTIDGYNNLTLLANAGASINDPTPSVPGDNDEIDILNSHVVTVQGFTINGGFDGVLCTPSSSCGLVGDTIQNTSDAAVVVGRASDCDIVDSTITNNALGVAVINGGQANIFGGTIQGSADAGVYAAAGAFLRVAASGIGPATVQNNGSDGECGIAMETNSTLVLASATVGSNPSCGVRLDLSSVMRMFTGAHVTGNGGAGGGAGIAVGDSSYLFLSGGADVTGNAGPQVSCNGQFSSAHGVGANAGLTCHTP